MKLYLAVLLLAAVATAADSIAQCVKIYFVYLKVLRRVALSLFLIANDRVESEFCHCYNTTPQFYFSIILYFLSPLVNLDA